MDKRIKKLWVEALRTGEYKKGVGSLRDVDSKGKTRFCCLGVLCNLHALEHPKLAAKETDPRWYLGQDSLLPLKVAEWAGFEVTEMLGFWKARSFGIDVKGRGYVKSLATYNDAGDNFHEIADRIRKGL